MEKINKYKLIKEFTNEDAGFCRWAYAEKEGHVYFIKQFMSPKFPTDNAKLSEKAVKARLEICESLLPVNSGYIVLYGKSGTEILLSSRIFFGKAHRSILLQILYRKRTAWTCLRFLRCLMKRKYCL